MMAAVDMNKRVSVEEKADAEQVLPMSIKLDEMAGKVVIMIEEEEDKSTRRPL